MQKKSKRNSIKKQVWGQPYENFSCHPRFRNKSYFFCLTALGSFILALKEEGSDENYDSNIEILLNYELPIVADITLLRQNEIFKLKIPLTSI